MERTADALASEVDGRGRDRPGRRKRPSIQDSRMGLTAVIGGYRIGDIMRGQLQN